jgi:NitT/TauT family transport system ATP-binding protein
MHGVGVQPPLEIRIDRPDRLSFGMVFQEPRLLPWRTVETNIRLALAPDERARPLDALLAGLGLSEWRDRYPRELSGGMARRVALARALAVRPDLLILDEPFVSLDARAAAELRALVFGEAERRRTTVLMVTHNLREALHHADRLVLLTPRPARVLDTIELPTSRADRTEDRIEAERRKLTERYPILSG